MQTHNSDDRWGVVQQALHWLVALAVLVQLTVGFTLAALPSDSAPWGGLFPIHTSLGLSILLLMLLRLFWRRSNPVPRLPETLPRWQQGVARGTHWLFYLLLIGLPIGGYLLVSAFGQPIPFFGLKLPSLLPESESLQGIIWTLHALGAVLVVALILLHVGGALRHEWLLKDNVLRRMTPFFPERGKGSGD
jgi:cytochrome b561